MFADGQSYVAGSAPAEVSLPVSDNSGPEALKNNYVRPEGQNVGNVSRLCIIVPVVCHCVQQFELFLQKREIHAFFLFFLCSLLLIGPALVCSLPLEVAAPLLSVKTPEIIKKRKPTFFLRRF